MLKWFFLQFLWVDTSMWWRPSFMMFFQELTLTIQLSELSLLFIFKWDCCCAWKMREELCHTKCIEVALKSWNFKFSTECNDFRVQCKFLPKNLILFWRAEALQLWKMFSRLNFYAYDFFQVKWHFSKLMVLLLFSSCLSVR